MKADINVENLKCEGCASTIRRGLMSIESVEAVQVDIGKAIVSIDYFDLSSIEVAKQKLSSLGYPERGSVQGLTKVTSKAKSLVSCAVGRFS